MWLLRIGRGVVVVVVRGVVGGFVDGAAYPGVVDVVGVFVVVVVVVVVGGMLI